MVWIADCAAWSWDARPYPSFPELGQTVLRTLANATPSVIYASADQVADRGALLGPGDMLAIRIYQLSTLVGRGTPNTVTLSF